MYALSKHERETILDAIKDATAEVEVNEDISMRVLDKLTTSIEILENVPTVMEVLV